MKETIIKFKNSYNFTTDAIKDRKVTIAISNFSLVCTLTYVDDDYVYGVFYHDGEDISMIELNNEKHIMSFEVCKKFTKFS
jgi:hypothetical protein